MSSLATVDAQFHGSTSGAATTLNVTVANPGTGRRLLVPVFIKAGDIASPYFTNSVTLGSTPLTRIHNSQLWNIYKLEIWALDSPSTSDTTVTVNAPTAVKMGAWPTYLGNCKSLMSPENIRFQSSGYYTDETQLSLVIPDTQVNDTQFLNLNFLVSDKSNQTFTALSPMTAIAADNSVATTNLHMAMGSKTQDKYSSAGPPFAPASDRWNLGIADVWGGVSITITGTAAAPTSCVPVISNLSGGGGSWTHTAEAGKTLYVIAKWLNSNPPTTVTFDGVQMTWWGWGRYDGANSHGFGIWSLVNPNPGAHTIDVGGAGGAAFNVANGPANGGVAGFQYDLNFNHGVGSGAVDVVGMGQDPNALVMGYCDGGGAITVTDGTALYDGGSSAVGYKQGNGGPTKISFSVSNTNAHFQATWTIPSACESYSGGMLHPWIGDVGLTDNLPRQWNLPYGPGGFVDTPRLPHYGRYLPLGCTLRNLKIKLTTAPGVGKSYTFMVCRNHVDTPLHVTISDNATEAELTGVDVSFPAYSIVSLRSDQSGGVSGSAFSYWIECETGAPNVSIYGGGTNIAAPSSVGSTGRKNPFYPSTANFNTTNAYEQGRIGANGSIVGGFGVYSVFGALGTGVYEACLFKDSGSGFVKQDGTGGTVNTKITIQQVGNGSTDICGAFAAGTFELPVAIGDQVYWELKATVAGNLGGSFAMTTLFRATTNGEFIINGADSFLGNNDFHIANDNTDGGSSTEADVEIKTGPSTSSLQILGSTWKITNAPGVGKGRTLTVRKSGADGFSSTITNTSTSGAASGAVTYASGDRLSLKFTEATTPAASGTSFWALRGYMDPAGVVSTLRQRTTQVVCLIGWDEDSNTGLSARFTISVCSVNVVGQECPNEMCVPCTVTK